MASSSEITSSPLRLGLWMTILLGLVSAIGPLSTDMYLPAFPQITHDLGGKAELTLAAWFIGLAIGQISQGPLSDRFGRKTPMIAGLSLYIAASVGCSFVSSFWLFCFCRFLAAIGGSAGMVIPRAMVRDMATGRLGAKFMAQLALVSGIVPVLAPTLGSLILLDLNWRGIFWFATVYGAIGLAAIIFFLTDTLTPERRIALSLRDTFWHYLTIAKEPVFISNTGIASFGSFVIFAYLGGTPAVYEHILHFSVIQFGVLFGINATCFILGTQLNGRLVKYISLGKLTNCGLASAFCCASILVILPMTPWGGAAHPYSFTLPLMGLLGSLGFVFSNSMVMAFTHHAHHAGSASSLLGTMQFSIGSISGMLIGMLPDNSVYPTVWVIMIGVIGMVTCNHWRRKVMPHGQYE